MHVIEEYWEIVIGALCFCIAVVLMLANMSEIDGMAEAVYSTSAPNSVMYEYHMETEDRETVTYTELYAMLTAGRLDCPIEIDGVLYTSDNMGYIDVQALALSGEYRFTRLFGEDGREKKIVAVKITGGI